MITQLHNDLVAFDIRPSPKSFSFSDKGLVLSPCISELSEFSSEFIMVLSENNRNLKLFVNDIKFK